MLDAATLHVLLRSIGAHIAPTAVFAAYATGTVLARVVPVPMGVGSYEASMIGMLRAIGIPVEAALAATLLLRGLTFWLPMAPGLWLARRELGTRRHARAARGS